MEDLSSDRGTVEVRRHPPCRQRDRREVIMMGYRVPVWRESTVKIDRGVRKKPLCLELINRTG